MIGEELIGYKTERVQAEWASLHPLLKRIVIQLAVFRWEKLHEKSILTCILSDKDEDKAVGRKTLTHREGRAVDIRANRDGKLEEEVRGYINRAFPTGLVEMPRIAPIVHGTGPHFHVQITRKEKKRTEG